MKSAAAVCCLIAMGGSVARAQWPNVNDKVKKKQVIIRSALVFPAEVSFSRVGVKGSEGGVPESDQIAESLYLAVARELSARGVTVLANPMQQAKDDAARFAVADMQARYASIAVQLHKKPGDVSKGRFTLGDGVARFEPAAGADVLVFLHGRGHVMTPGRTALGLAMKGLSGIGPEFGSEVAFVDAKTGEVLVYFHFTRYRDMTKDADDRFSHTLREWLHDIPLPSPPSKK